MPEQIWASTQTPLAQSKSGTWNEYPYGKCYIRKDLHTAAIAERDALHAENESLREALRKISRLFRSTPNGHMADVIASAALGGPET